MKVVWCVEYYTKKYVLRYNGEDMRDTGFVGVYSSLKKAKDFCSKHPFYAGDPSKSGVDDWMWRVYCVNVDEVDEEAGGFIEHYFYNRYDKKLGNLKDKPLDGKVVKIRGKRYKLTEV